MRLFAQIPQDPAPAFTSDALHSLAVTGLSEAGARKPPLLRALTDLFVMRPAHTREETRQFAEIAHRLLADATEAERDHAAEALRRHPAAPPDVLDRLATYDSDGARKLLAECRALSTHVLHEAASGRTDAALAVAQRIDLDPETIRLLARREEIDVLRALARNDYAPLDVAALTHLVARARHDDELALALVMRLPHRPEVLPLFMMANTRERAKMIARARESAGEDEAPSNALEHGRETALRRIEAIALEGAQDDFAIALAEACGCDEAQARAIVDDAGGEPLAVALRALGLKPEIVTRIFLFVDPQISHVYGRVSALAKLADGLSQQVAQRILDAITGRAIAPVKHASLHDQAARISSSRAGARQLRAPRSAADLLKRTG